MGNTPISCLYRAVVYKKTLMGVKSYIIYLLSKSELYKRLYGSSKLTDFLG